MNSENVQPVGDFASGPVPAPKGKRFAVAVIDLVLVPIVIGIVAGLILMAVPEGIRNILLVGVNVGWLIFRDLVYSPGRKMVGLKLVSLSGEKVTFVQALVRNLLLIVPFVLVIGYLVEILMIAIKNDRLADGWAKTRVTLA